MVQNIEYEDERRRNTIKDLLYDSEELQRIKKMINYGLDGGGYSSLKKEEEIN